MHAPPPPHAHKHVRPYTHIHIYSLSLLARVRKEYTQVGCIQNWPFYRRLHCCYDIITDLVASGHTFNILQLLREEAWHEL